MGRYSKAVARATGWARSSLEHFRGIALVLMAALVWSAAVLWILWLLVAATGGLLIDAAKSGRQSHTLRHRLHEAERAHRSAVAAAQAELTRRQSAYAKAVADAEAQLAALRDPNGKRLRRCRGVTLYERTIATPQGTVPLIGVRAHVDTAGNLAVTKRATLTRTGAGFLVAGPVGAVVGGAGFKKTKKIDTRELYLRIESPRLSCVVKCPPDQGARIRSFAAAINTAAAQAPASEAQRPQRIHVAENALASAKAQTAPIEAARAQVAQATGDPELLAAIATARRELDAYTDTKSVRPALAAGLEGPQPSD